MDSKVLEYEVIGSVAVIAMNNPPVNALGLAFLEEFEEILERLRSPGEARAVLLRSACPGFFSAGDDIAGLAELDDAFLDTLPRAQAFLDALENLPLPTVAAINGHALGGGCELAMVCDLRFMASGPGRIGLPEARLGMIPALGGTQRLPLLVGKGKAMEMMFKGLQMTAEEAAAIGLVNGVFAPAEHEEKCFDYATRLAAQATSALARIKACVNTGSRDGFAKGLALEKKSFRENIVYADAREGVRAFLEGRKPRFEG